MQKSEQNGHESKNGLQKFEIVAKEKPKRFTFKSLCNLYERKRRWFLDLIWPTSPYLVLYFNIFWLVWFLRQNETKQCSEKENSDLLIPNWLEKSILSSQLAIISFFAFVLIRQIAIQTLLSYHGWLYGNKSILVKIWGVLLKILFFASAPKGFFSAQRILPRLSVPSLNGTFNRLIESQKGIISKDELEKLEINSDSFIHSIGRKLQLFLVIKSWISTNYITDWWGDFVYLRSRESIAITSNVAGFGQSYWTPTNSQVVRASVLTHLLVRFKREIDHGVFSPVSISQTIPLCSHFYRKLFSSTRIPGPEIDQIKHYQPHISKHIAVVSPQGFLYKLPVFDSNYKLLEPRCLQKGFEWIIKDSEVRSRKSSQQESSRSLPSLTTLPRSKWAEIRGKYLISNEVNAKSLGEIESSIICLVLSSSDLPNLKAHTYLMSLADGKSIWYDKSLNFIISKDARTGFNLEHSVTDGSQIAHVWEQILSEESTSKFYTEQGECMPFPKSYDEKPGIISQPEYLQWEINPELELEINEAVKFSQEQNEDIDMYSYDFDDFGKDEMKNIKISPDAFFQSAIGLAYYRDQGKLPNTYEPTLMRLFANGRTETVRSTTLNLKNFILGMDNKELSKGQKIHLFKKSVDSHQKLFKDAMSGKGVDRHLFGLYIAGKALNYDVSFLESILNKPWTLVTSQVPGDQIAKPLDLKHKYFKDKYSMGGIFITTCNEGYGLGYYFGSQTKIFYQVSSKLSCLKTDSKRYSEEISKALKDIMNLFI